MRPYLPQLHIWIGNRVTTESPSAAKLAALPDNAMFKAIEFAVAPAVTVAGLLIILAILSETFEVMLLPRRVPRRVRAVRVFFRLTWWAWSGLGVLRPEGPPRQRYLAVYGPLSMVLLIITWALGLMPHTRL